MMSFPESTVCAGEDLGIVFHLFDQEVFPSILNEAVMTVYAPPPRGYQGLG